MAAKRTTESSIGAPNGGEENNFDLWKLRTVAERMTTFDLQRLRTAAVYRTANGVHLQRLRTATSNDFKMDDVRSVRDIPEWFTDKSELFSNIRRIVKNIPKYAPTQFYIDNVLRQIKEKKIMSLKPIVDRLGYGNVPQEVNRLRCKVNYHSLKFLPKIEQMSDQPASRMRNHKATSNPYMALHLSFEKGMVGLSFCDYVANINLGFYACLAEIEKIDEIVVNGLDSEKISAASILCGASLIHGWNIEHTVLVITNLLSPPVPTDYSGNESYLISYAPFLNSLLFGISSTISIS